MRASVRSATSQRSETTVPSAVLTRQSGSFRRLKPGRPFDGLRRQPFAQHRPGMEWEPPPNG